MVKFESKHGKINVREIAKPDIKGTDIVIGNRPALLYRHTVKLTFNNKNTQFRYSTSINDFESGEIMMSDDDLHYALSAFLGDGLCSIGGFENFCSELGYEMYTEDPDETDRATGYSRKSVKVYKACKKSRKQAEHIGITEDMAYEIVDEIRTAGYE